MINIGLRNSYQGHTSSKKLYLKRKKEINREINEVKKKKLKCKYRLGKAYCDLIIKKGNKDLYLLRSMYNICKRASKKA